MPRPIKMTEEMKQQARKDFDAVLDGIKMSDGKFNYSKSYIYEESKATIWLTQEAYRKMVALVTEFSSEVGWHGTVSRSADNEFVVEDIFVYPQEVTSSTVNTDQFAYTEWLYSLNDDVFNNLRMHGHSHCNMGVSPSGVDENHRQGILDQLEPDMFYVFMIWNKSFSAHALIYDMARNILFENDDIEIILQNDESVNEFLSDSLQKVKKPSSKKKPALKKQDVEQLGLDYDFEDYDFRYMRGLHHSYMYGGEAWEH